MIKITIAFITLLFLSNVRTSRCWAQEKVWGYICENEKCNKVQINEVNVNNIKALSVCRMFCSDSLAAVWPRPTGSIAFEEDFVSINPLEIMLNVPESALWNRVEKRFLGQLFKKIGDHGSTKIGRTLEIKVVSTMLKNKEKPKLTLDTDESYKLSVSSNDTSVVAIINSNSFFGARHGIETLSQLIVYDNIDDKLKIVGRVEINDGPVFKWRGIVLDTSRNFFSLNTIKTILDGMAMSKLNTFHWHITDSHSFPFEVKSYPDLYKLGAYDTEKIYTHAKIEEILDYALERGIRILPEFDAPAHVGEGWQNFNMTVCFKAQPWENYCVEPPCGQLDPSIPELYDVLEKIYFEMESVFQPDVFHMGGDEVSFNCWNSSTGIQKWMMHQGWGLKEEDFMQLWNYFQQEALKRFDKIKNSNETPIILWTSRFTETPYIEKYIDPNRYIIQIWTAGNDPNIQNILKHGLKIIISNYDTLYLDCGGPGWVNSGQNWCSPYHGWQKIYSNELLNISKDFEGQVLGAEAAIWSEQIDDFTVLPRVFPRLSALGENLWSNLGQNWRKAESRMMLHRDLLVQNNIPAEALQPQWCLQNENECPLH